MSTTVDVIKKVYRSVVPPTIRESKTVAALRTRLLGHDWTYDSDYFRETIEGPATRSAGTIAASIMSDFEPTCVVDVGCGTGALLEALRDRGCQVFGLEYAEAALQYCRTRQLDVAKFDLEKDVLNGQRTFDVAISMEVAEHLPEKVANRYVDLMTSLSQIVVLTAAHPGQGGTDHVNTQPASYWITKFRQRGFEHAETQSQRWSDSWRASGDVASFYYENLMIFRRKTVNARA